MLIMTTTTTKTEEGNIFFVPCCAFLKRFYEIFGGDFGPSLVVNPSILFLSSRPVAPRGDLF